MVLWPNQVENSGVIKEGMQGEGTKQAVWQAMLCDCGKTMGRTSSPRCEVCWTHPTHGVEVRLTESSMLLYALRNLPAYKEVMGH